jgi:hypothetical protein
MRSLMVAGFVTMAGMGCATTTGSATTNAVMARENGAGTSIERVVFDDDPTGPRQRVVGPHAVTVGWRIDVSGRGPDGKLARSVECVYEDVVADAVERETAPPAEVTARAARLAARLNAPLTVAHR